MNTRPARIIAALVAFFGASLALAAAFGLKLSDDQLRLLPAWAVAMGALVQGLWTERSVFSPDSAKALLQAPASSLDPKAVIDTAKRIGTSAANVVASDIIPANDTEGVK